MEFFQILATYLAMMVVTGLCWFYGWHNFRYPTWGLFAGWVVWVYAPTLDFQHENAPSSTLLRIVVTVSSLIVLASVMHGRLTDKYDSRSTDGFKNEKL